jgi:hypothetical protein
VFARSLVAVLVACTGALAQAPNPLSILGGGSSTDALAGSLRGYLIEHMPPVLLDEKYGWGETKLVARGLEWKADSTPWWPSVQKSYKNHGVWRHVVVTTGNLRETMVFDLSKVKKPKNGRMTFEAFLALNLRVVHDQQNWRAGLKLYSGSAIARLRARVRVKCEIVSKLEKKEGSLLPDVVFRFSVLKAEVSYDDLVLEHVAGVGGELARILGEATVSGARQWKPSLERNLLAKAEATILKAGKTKEVRLGASSLFKKK